MLLCRTDQHLQETLPSVTARRWAPETDPQWGPRHLDSIRKRPLEPVEPLQSDFGTSYWFVWPEGNCPRLSLVSPKVFSPFCHRWSFGSLPLSPLSCLVGDTSFPAISSTWFHRYYLNWTELDNDITEFNNEMPSTENLVLNPVILHYWHHFPILILCSCFSTICIVKSTI